MLKFTTVQSILVVFSFFVDFFFLIPKVLSQRRGLITLSFKKGDRLDPKNWRPITLLNVDYKIASRALAGRLRQIIHAVVAPDQSCGVPGRYIGENVSFLRDVVHFASSSDVPVALLSLDQEKAFDRVDWSFLRRINRNAQRFPF